MKSMIKRNTKLFFKDKGMFFTALITPGILLVLYATFLGKVYRDSFLASLPEGVTMTDKLIDGFVGGQLVSSILAVSCVTVAFCSNMRMVQDKANGTIKDLTISPVRTTTLALSYYIGTLLSTLIISFVGALICFAYVASVGWYMSITDIIFVMADIFLLVMFGTALSSLINFFLSSQGQISAVGTIMSAGYGFICGAYMPLSQFSEGLQKVLLFLPGTYGTSLIRNHSLAGVFRQMNNENLPDDVIESFKGAVDCNLYFFGERVPVSIMYVIMIASILLFLGIYIMLNVMKRKATK